MNTIIDLLNGNTQNVYTIPPSKKSVTTPGSVDHTHLLPVSVSIEKFSNFGEKAPSLKKKVAKPSQAAAATVQKVDEVVRTVTPPRNMNRKASVNNGHIRLENRDEAPSLKNSKNPTEFYFKLFEDRCHYKEQAQVLVEFIEKEEIFVKDLTELMAVLHCIIIKLKGEDEVKFQNVKACLSCFKGKQLDSIIVALKKHHEVLGEIKMFSDHLTASLYKLCAQEIRQIKAVQCLAESITGSDFIVFKKASEIYFEFLQLMNNSPVTLEGENALSQLIRLIYTLKYNKGTMNIGSDNYSKPYQHLPRYDLLVGDLLKPLVKEMEGMKSAKKPLPNYLTEEIDKLQQAIKTIKNAAELLNTNTPTLKKQKSVHALTSILK